MLSLGVCLWGGWYAYNRGFTKKWRLFVESEFHKRGVELYFSRLTLDPFQGLVARDVKIFDAKDHTKVLAVINRIVLDINYGNLVHGEPFLNGIDLRDARLVLPVDPADPDSPRIAVSGINAQVLLPPHQLYVRQAEAVLYGVHIFATGRLINPESFHPAAQSSPEDTAKRKQGLKKWIDELSKFRFPDAPPRVEIRFSGDLAEPEKIFAEATLWGEKIRHGSYQLENLYAALSYRDGELKLARCTASDGRGTLDASGTMKPGAHEAGLELQSTLDIQRLAHALNLTNALEEFIFYSPPKIQMSARTELGPQPKFKLIGSLALQKFGCKSAIFEGLDAGFSFDGGRWYVRDFKLAHRTGELAGSALQVSGDFQAKLQSTINPKAFAPLLSGKAAALMSELNFQQSPEVELTARGSSPSFDACVVSGALKLGRTRFRGVGLKSAASKVRIADKAVTYEQFKLDRDEGGATGSFAYDFGRHEVRLDHIKTSVNTIEVAAWIHPGLVHDVAPYKFKTAPNLDINGIVQFDGGKNTNLQIDVDAPGGMDYVFLKKTLSSPRISGKLLFTDGRLRISNLLASLYSGRVRGSADISLKREAPGHSAKIEVEKIDFPKLTKLYFNYDTAKGALSGSYDFTGRGSDARTMQGRGQVSVVDGDVFAIPVLGPLSGILNSIVPGMGYNLSREASASFEIRNSVIETRDFIVKGQGFDMLGEGRLFFLDDKIDFTIRLNAQGLPGVLLFPVSKLFEYVSDGSLSKPAWKPKRLPTL